MSDEPQHPGRIGLANVFVDVASALVGPGTVGDLAQSLVDGCVEVLGVWAAGLLVADPGSTPKVLAASTHQAELLELVQVRSGQGPCLEAISAGALVLVEDLAARQDEWPEWVAGARALGIRHAYGIPLQGGGETFGALNLFRTDAGPLSREDLVLARALADVATAGILQNRALDQATTLSTQLQRALESRVAIEQAKGVLAERAGISVAEAFVRLRQEARSSSRPLSAVAQDLLGTSGAAGGAPLDPEPR